MKKTFVLILAAVILLFHNLPVPAQDRVEVCTTYLGTGKKYKVDATVLTGTELNLRTATFNYQPLSTYAVIFWGPGQATVIELEFAIGGISAFGTRGRDQQGYRWELTTSSLFCY
jgi:hypothetical protein